MPSSFAAMLHDWRDFYLLIGTASATLVGLMFVAASIGSSIFNEKHSAPLNAFLSPTVAHFTAVLVASLLMVIPTLSWRILGGLLGVGGLAGLAYSGRILVQIIIQQIFKVDFSDRTFYALIPVLGYLLSLCAAVLLFMESAASANVIAAALMILLLAGIRNAWDMMVWIAINAPSGRETSS
ncbi:MAG: hypothetical protein ACLPID_07555 [Beijerinckiaceae bacterium]